MSHAVWEAYCHRLFQIATVVAISTVLPRVVTAQVDPTGRAVLFLRGAAGSGGARAGGDEAARTAQLSDINSSTEAAGNKAFGTLRTTLQNDGFAVEQWIESKHELTLVSLLRYRIVVFGSNNRVYSAREVAAFHAYIDAGGSALFIGDADWGRTWEAAAASDNQFLARYGVSEYQDNDATVIAERKQPGRFAIAAHPVLSGPDGIGGTSDVGAFAGDGVSLFHVGPGSSGYQARIIVSAVGLRKRLNRPSGNPGRLVAADDDDACVFVVERGASRIIGYHDRSTFFNKNGLGTDLTQLDNRRLAINLFRFLASVPAQIKSVGKSCTANRPLRLEATSPLIATDQVYRLKGARPNVPTVMLLSLGRAVAFPLPGGCALYVHPFAMITMIAPATHSRGHWSLTVPFPNHHRLSGTTFTAQVLCFVGSGPALGVGELSNGLEMQVGFPR